jgi:hypothetical protein
MKSSLVLFCRVFLIFSCLQSVLKRRHYVAHSEEPSDANRNGKFPEAVLDESGRSCRLPHSNNGSDVSSAPNDHVCTVSLSEGQSPEVYIPGLIVHIVPVKDGTSPWRKTSLVTRTSVIKHL